MEVYLISNNLFENNLVYSQKDDIEKKKLTRPLSIAGEDIARNLALKEEFESIQAIYSSSYSSSLATARYLAERISKKINVNDNLNDQKVGILGTRSLKMIKFMQNHDFDIKLNNGESLSDVGNRINGEIHKIILTGKDKIAVFTHKRGILGYLLKHGKPGYNLDDNLIVEFNDKVIMDESEKEIDIIKLTFNSNNKLIDINVIDY